MQQVKYLCMQRSTLHILNQTLEKMPFFFKQVLPNSFRPTHAKKISMKNNRIVNISFINIPIVI